ncbi:MULTISPECIES: FAD-dependent oxidoreductase [unclassified Mesorhizobium]|uniref:FAD-dependent oxidoreductase n=1 Tax=unclassified Mesorhizobium TaxID=325217 RepID=UPI0010930EF1|nr:MULTISPECIES: FAD-dependent oxidoreductase [unclassified Mesorhizobium]TGP85996.1 FAD-dependent oxidoreductase [Mesorhizobium sp. M8A.F.Ca.ET.218.01.1.1]TGT14906.1 FAD-dependent oxidoreductase [Mesorhizobium sp. M8A.F.Ca.ET.213.01.1.1]
MNARGEQTRSLWMKIDVYPDAPKFLGKKSCDTVIIGSGIAGLSVAYELSSTGHKVIVIDRGAIAGGMTSRTTAHLAPICDDGLSALINLRGEETARLFQESQEAAVARIQQNVEELAIDCNFRRLDAFLFPAMGVGLEEARDQRKQEFDAARKVRAAAELVTGVPLKGFETAPVLRYPNQATFHPLRYLRGLATAIRDKGGRMFANSPVISVEELREGRVLVSTVNGGVIEAASAVVATNSPINDRFQLHTKMSPYRTYAMAFTLPRGDIPDALFWDTGDPYHYVRMDPGPGSVDYLIAGGADHKSGEADDGDVRFEAIEAWIRALVPALGNEVTRWSGQVLDTIDYCAFIGLNPGSKSVYVVTGDSGQGMTHGALSGMLLKDLIVGKENPLAAVYEPSRKMSSGVVNYVRENLSAVKNLAGYLLPGELKSLKELVPGQGGILREGIHKIAACRDRSGKLHLLSPVCTHSGCEVVWNSTEQCWDCSCHGSHFAPDGTVLNGPAVAPLEPAGRPAEGK